jgi:hypothetical protein
MGGIGVRVWFLSLERLNEPGSTLSVERRYSVNPVVVALIYEGLAAMRLD